MHPTKANFLHPAALHSAAFSILDEELPPSSVGPDQGFGIAGQRWICGSLWAYKIYTLYVDKDGFVVPYGHMKYIRYTSFFNINNPQTSSDVGGYVGF